HPILTAKQAPRNRTTITLSLPTKKTWLPANPSLWQAHRPPQQPPLPTKEPRDLRSAPPVLRNHRPSRPTLVLTRTRKTLRQTVPEPHEAPARSGPTADTCTSICPAMKKRNNVVHCTWRYRPANTQPQRRPRARKKKTLSKEPPHKDRNRDRNSPP